MTLAGANLHELFTQTRQQQSSLSSLDPRSDDYKLTLSSIVTAYSECRRQITQLALFSPNEELDDLSTGDIQYLSIDFLLAELLLRSYDDDRQQSLNRAVESLDAFLTRLDQYGVLSASDRKLYGRFQENKTAFSLASAGNMEERRRMKIARFQEEKALKGKLEYLRTQSQQSNTDDETTRSLYLAELALFASQTFQSLDMINQELDILSQARFAEPPPRQAQPRTNGNDTYSERLDDLSRPGLRNGGPLLSKSGKPLQPFTLTDKRTQLQKGVFKPGHSLPTMSIDEYLEEEKRRGGIVDGGGNANEAQQVVDEDDMEAADAATMKAREWDEFVEANPKGAGNTLNRG